MLKGEASDLEAFTQNVSDVVFDYFNMIDKEYLMTVNKWSSDMDYIK